VGGRTTYNSPLDITTNDFTHEQDKPLNHNTDEVSDNGKVKIINFRKRKCTICQEQNHNNEPRSTAGSAAGAAAGTTSGGMSLTRINETPTPSFGQDTTIKSEEDRIVLFEFSLELRRVRSFVYKNYKTTTSEDKVWFHGSLDVITGQIIEAHIRNSPMDYIVYEQIVVDE
jgi:hypothetical protein